MEPISLATSVWGLLRASENIISFLSSIAKAPSTVANVITECHALNALFLQIKDFISDRDQQYRSRVDLDDLVATLTACVYTFSELERVLRSLVATTNDGERNDYEFTFDKLKWKAKEKSIEKILQNMQINKSSLNSLIYSRSVTTYFDDFAV
jgi:hypothetical protein